MIPPDHKPVLTRDDMRRLDRATIDGGVPSIDLMERAGEGIVEFLSSEVSSLCMEARREGRPPTVLVLAGPGNNGGDGFVVARLLATEGWTVTVALCAPEPARDSNAGINLRRWQDLGGECIDVPTCLTVLSANTPQDYDLVVDALFGTGLVRPLEGTYLDLVSALNASGLATVSVDTPSGLCADRGEPLGVAVFARATVTLGAAKPGLFCGVGPNHAGRIVVVDIGLLAPEEVGIEPVGYLIDGDACRGWMPHRHRMTHKGELGHVLVVGGSMGRVGAVLLAARAALRAGAGLVTMAVPEPVAATADTALVEAMTLPLAASQGGEPASSAWSHLASDIDRFDSVVVGPGLGTTRGSRGLVIGLIEHFAGALVIDADGLNVLAAERKHLGKLLASRAEAALGPVIVTPHPGEMGRLLGQNAAAVQDDRLGTLRRLCGKHDVTVVLKGAGTLVSDGRRTGFNVSGNPGMATAGMGDVLAGLIGTLAAQKPDAFEAASLGVYLHGRAGDLLESRLGVPGFMASELADALPQASAMVQSSARG